MMLLLGQLQPRIYSGVGAFNLSADWERNIVDQRIIEEIVATDPEECYRFFDLIDYSRKAMCSIIKSNIG